MSVNIIDTLKPKNGLSFPVVEAIDVFVENYDNLADAISHFATDAMIAAINAVLSGKANTSDVNTAVSGLQTQIDQIAQAAGTGSADTEVAQARVTDDGTSYNTLKDRLDTGDAETANSINNIETDVQNLAENNEYNLYFSDTWQNKDVTVTGGVVTLTSSTTTLFSGYIDISSLGDNDEYKVSVPDGYKAYLWSIDANDGTYTKLYDSGGWITSQAVYTHRALSSVYKYLVIKVQKVDGSQINPSIGNWIKVFITKQTEISQTVLVLTASQAIISENVNEINANLTDISASFQNLAENNEYNLYFSDTWQNKDVTVTENTVTLTTSAKTIFSGYVDISSLEDNDEYIVAVPSGYRAYLWGIDKNDGTYTKSYNSGGWITSASDFTHRALSSTYGYIIIKVQKTDNSDISASEGNQIKLYVTKQTEISKTVADLSTSQTELSEDVGEISTDVDVIKSEISSIEQGQVQSELEIPISFTSGRVTLSANVITTSENPKFAYFKFAQLEYGKEYSIYIPSGIDIFAYIVNRTNNTYTRMEEFTPTWKSGEQTFKNTVSSIMQDYELVLSAKKTNNTNITVEEANGVKVTYLDETELPFMTNLKQAMGFKPVATKGQILYNADSKSESDYIVNAVSYKDGTIIACRSDGRVVRVNLDGTEETLLTITGSGFDWRCCYIDKNENVYVSPHATWGSMNVADRGLYKLSKGENSFVKVLALYDSSSSDPVLTQNNDDTIWTMCEDDNGYLYAGVYSHTVRFRPRIYKSTDGGNTWTCVVDFISSGIAPSGHHIHCVIYNPWQKALYCIVGEINTIFKSTDGGTSWINLDVELTVKGTAMLPTPNGNVIGSDGAYNCDVDFLYNDDATHEKVFRGWANTVFGTRVSDITGFIYVFTKIDSSVNNAEYMPPYGVLYGTKTLAAWKAGEYTEGHVPTHLAEWEAYNASVAEIYPDDAIRPQHYSILISRDGGKTFSVLKAIECSSAQANGIWTVGYFENGECLCGVYHNGAVANPIVISEGKHKFVAGGCDLTGEIFVRTNTSPIVQL